MNEIFSIDDSSGFSDAQRARIKAELVPGERLLWASIGRISPNVGCGPVSLSILALVFLVASAILFLFFFRHIGPRDGLGGKDFLGAVVIGLIGVVLVIVAYGAWIRKRDGDILPGCLYALTHRRAIVWRPAGTATEVVSILPSQVMNISRVERANGTGDIRFWAGQVVDIGDSIIWDCSKFVGIENVRLVEDMARQVFFPDFLAPSSDPMAYPARAD